MRAGLTMTVVAGCVAGFMGAALPRSAVAEEILQDMLANAGAGGRFEVGEEAHTIAALKSPAHYRVCSVMHRQEDGTNASIEVTADGATHTIGHGQCTDVEAASISVRSTSTTYAYGAYSKVN